MIISSSQVQNVIKLYGKHIHRTGLTPKPDVTAPFAKTDQVSISADSRIKQKAIQAAKAAPDIREDRIQGLKEAIATGTYQVTDAEVAEKILFRNLVDKMV